MTTTAPRPVTTVQTVATLIRDRATAAPDQVALREKSLGVWQETTWAGYWDAVETAAHGFLALGIETGDRIAIHSENRTEWVVTDSATVAVRGISMGLYPTNPSAEVEYLLGNSGSRVHVAEDQEQVDKVLAVKHNLPELEKIIYFEGRGVDRYEDPMLMSWDAFMELGRSHRAANSHALTERMAGATEDDIAYLIYTSGTTGPPKGAMLTVANVNYVVQRLADTGGIIDPPPGPEDELVSYLPLCHVFEKAFGHWFNVGKASVTNYGESLDTLPTDLREVQPTIFEAVPRIWEKMHASMLIRMSSASLLKRLNYGFWMKRAEKLGKRLVDNGGTWTPWMRVQYGLGYLFLYRAVKERLGLKRCRYGVSGAAPIAPEILEFFMGIGVPIYEGYGMTENSAVATANRPGRVKVGTVGEPYDDIELKLDEQTGEILIRHPGVFAGYWRNPEATAATLDADGWLHTGDVGEWVDGTHVKIVDRIKDIIITAGGKNISPSEIENTLKMSPFVGEVIVIGDRRKFLSALIGIDYDVVSEWAQRKGLAHTTYRDLAEKPEVRELIQRQVTDANAKFASVEQIKKFGLLTKELDHEEGELTATQKVKRSVIEEKFAEEIEAMYR
ncbi:MAG: long-chain fatty acid--CoA ligase [Acidimicrobiia bacterium]|nr:long-chain fatty acid--CoA ligase [Acidimicrobiia bacterium]